MPVEEIPLANFPRNDSCFTAAINPSMIPKIEINIIEIVASSNVAGSLRFRSSITGLYVKRDIPKSPCNKSLIYIKYCTDKGLSRLSSCRAASIISSDRCEPTIKYTGDPINLVTKNAIEVISIKTISKLIMRLDRNLNQFLKEFLLINTRLSPA